MELKFAWIDEYKNIKAQGFNFSPMERFAYDPVSEILSFEDTSKEAIDGFFGEHFLNVTAIIGENGSGKSNLIEFVLSRIASFGNGYFIGFNNLGKEIFVLDKTIISSQKVNFSNKQSLEEEGFTFSSYKESVFEAFGRLLEAIQEIGNTYIFYSPTLDFRDFGNGLANLYDFSTNTLFYSDQSSDPTVYRQNEGGFFPDLSAHVFMEVKRHLDFISAGIKDLPFKLPKNLNIKVVRFSKNRFLSKSTEWIETNNLKVQYEYLELFERDLGVNTADKSGKFKQILASSFLGLLMANYPEPFSGLQREDLRKWIYDQEFPNTMGNDDLDEKLGELKDYFQILKDITESFPHSYLNRNRENHPDKHEWELNNEILIECSDASIENIKKLHSTYNKITDSKSLQNFYWGALSSGERNLLNLFSRLYSFQVEVNNETQLPFKDIILFLDEGASGFHPNWQKEYFKSLIQTLPKIFCFNPDGTPNGRKIQLVITSHSPFVISNLPNGNIIFLKRDDAGNCRVVDGLHQKKQTFGANIHSLLSDSFFLNGLIGDFAQDKIDQVIRFLQGKEQMDLMEAKKLISIVGEPLIRRYMEKEMEKLNQKAKFEQFQNRVKNLEDELNALKNDQDQA